MLERLKWPGTALLLGVLGALVRRWQMTYPRRRSMLDELRKAGY